LFHVVGAPTTDLVYGNPDVTLEIDRIRDVIAVKGILKTFTISQMTALIKVCIPALPPGSTDVILRSRATESRILFVAVQIDLAFSFSPP
jgi:hypothetical protein